MLWWYHLERGGMPLHDAVGINCKKGPTTENQGAVGLWDTYLGQLSSSFIDASTLSPC